MTGTRGGEFHAVLLAGGGGTRFWPASRAGRPKQFLALAGRDPLLVASWKRIRRLAPASRTWVIAPRALARAIGKLLPELRADRLVVEPAPRDTAPAATLATLSVAAAQPDAVVGLFPADHVVRDEDAFVASVQAAIDAARREQALVCLGVVPDRPATGFGYLECRAAPRGNRPCEVRRFVEKPDARRAAAFVRSGRYLWNAGMFVYAAATFAGELRRAAPALYRAVERHIAGRPGAWGKVPRISLDYALMERARCVRAVPLRAGWDDVGSWAGVADDAAGGALRPILVDSPGCAVRAGHRIVALVGMKDTVVVDTDDALLVVARDRAEDVRAVVAELKRRKRKELL